MASAGGGRNQWLREGKPASATHAIEKSPQFRSSLERFAERAGERLGAAFGAPFTAALDAPRNARTFAALGEHLNQPAVALRSEALDGGMAMLFEGGVVPALIATMFGDEPDPADAPRPPTALELRMVRELADALARALVDAFAPVADFDISSTLCETLEDETLLGPKDAPAWLAPVTVKAPSCAFGLTLLLPHLFLSALAAAFVRGPAPGAAKLDPIWSNRMERRVVEASLTLTAILDEFQMSLADVSSLRVGHVLPLSDEGQGRVRMESGERGVFVCSLGERGGRYALEVEDIIARTVEGPYPGAGSAT